MIKPARNKPCPCNSGKKYKHCCQYQDEQASTAALPDGLSIKETLQVAIKHHDANRLQQANELYQKILQINPNHADALHLLGLLAREAGEVELGIELIQKAIKAHPTAAMHFNLGVSLHTQKKYDDAKQSYKNAIRIDPNYIMAYTNLGAMYQQFGDMKEAEKYFKQAISSQSSAKTFTYDPATLPLNPTLSTTYSNLGISLLHAGKFEDALACLEQASRLKPADHAARWNTSLAFLAMGRLTEGWQLYENRFLQKEQEHELAQFPQVRLNNIDQLAEKTILVWPEQGIGDQILFASIYSDIIKNTGHCLIECDDRLISLFSRSFPQAEFVARQRPPLPRTLTGDIDLQCPAGDLSRFFRNSITDFPDHNGYLKADPERVAHWQQRLKTLGSGLNVGICWRSMKQDKIRDLYYTKPDQWGSIFSVPGINFINLQYDNCSEELEAARSKYAVNIHTWEDIDLLNDLDDAAALTSALDLIIAPSTSVVSMAGALGKRTWLMQPNPSWTMLGSKKMIWYPNTRLFFRGNEGNWDRVLDRIAEELKEMTRIDANIAS